MITITENAAIFLEAILERNEQKKIIRLCSEKKEQSDKNFSISFVENVSEDDISLSANDLTLSIPKADVSLLMGSVIDYKQNGIRSGFVIQNLNIS